MQALLVKHTFVLKVLPND